MIRSAIRTPQVIKAASGKDGSADFGALVHLGVWGGVAAACLLVVAIASRTDTGQTRLASAYANWTGQRTEAEHRQRAERKRQSDEARRMAESIRDLTEDRDRLLARMAVLERSYEDVTGSIGKLANAGGSPPGSAPIAAAAAAAPLTTPTPLAVANAPATAPAATAAPAQPEPQEPVAAKSAFGVDIAGGANMAALRTAWDRLRRNHSAHLDGLHPVIAVRDGRGGHVELRLVAGPIANAATAARLCASLAAAGLSCQPTAFDGQRLAVR